MAQNSIMETVRRYLSAQHMLVDEDWLSGCVEYLSEDNANNVEIIKNLAREQWLLNDLKDICPGSLPANLKNQPKTVLNGRYVLQINAAIDIGTPAYQQYLKLQKINMENVEATTKFEDKISSHRMIKLYLTDGVQDVTAIEYRQMRNISCDITPGCKVLMKGPIECRRGMLLLTEGAVELLGGEVQEIAVSNSLAGLLSTKLHLPITREADTVPTAIPRSPVRPTTPSPPAAPSAPARRPVARVTSLQLAEFNDDDIDIDQLTAIEANFDNNKRPLNNPVTSQQKKLKTDPPAHTNRDDYPDDDDVIFVEDEEYLKEIEAEIEARERRLYGDSNTGCNNKSVPAEPFVYIKQLNDMSESDRVGRVFKIKGQIMKLLSKLSVGKEGWSLKCTLVDGTGAIDVEFTSDVLSKLVGYTPQEMNLLKKQMASKPELKEQAVTALQKAKDSLQVLYCIIELTMLEVPKITQLQPFEQHHLQMLSKRLEGVGVK